MAWFRHSHAPRQTLTLPVHLGRDDMTEVARRCETAARGGDDLVVEIVGFDYFDQDSLDALTRLVDRSMGHVVVRGLDDFVDAVCPQPLAIVDLRSVTERALRHLSSVSVVVGRELDETSWELALEAADAAGRPIVTLDLLYVSELSPRALIDVGELSAQLQRNGRQLILVNANPTIAHQLERAGLSGGLRMSVDWTV